MGLHTNSVYVNHSAVEVSYQAIAKIQMKTGGDAFKAKTGCYN